ncbi:hypothetical protein VCSRO153_1975 [Vibrio cholerae]|uniref:hypothetical protein n=1 Tax=Vibrio cholerae TaxID=666 RepID=UPI0011DB27D6|nr:hypothetical protein [Vibrio cholerae]EGR2440630.1 hypothetical protein [Vibrio cholerae]TXX34541.1 hypothetical protein FXF13_16875 [Vibrio cholerae]BCK23875.1 hypothetical protein VCSRO63_0710 [Vibrio cholerae]GHW68011.1 hypothetical protein VCSRO153_1975 [Vibrio cholerae]HDZ9678334.1 hypothetical protein [Vibrio cholerae]
MEQTEKIYKCKSCKETVQKDAKKCPHCGEKYPTVSNAKGCLGFIVLSLIFGIIMASCSDNPKQAFKPNQVTASNFAFTLANQPAVDISLKQDSDNFCQITMLRKNVNAGYSASLKQQSSGELSSSCNVNGKLYIQSSNHPTFASLKVLEIDNTNKTAKLSTSLKLVDNKTLKSYFEVNDLTFIVSGDQFSNLITLPSES